MFKYIFKQLRRSIVTNVLFCLLLTLSGTLLCITAGLWYSAHKALLDIDETITTIAIPDKVAINRFAFEQITENQLNIGAHISAADIIETEQNIFQSIVNDIYSSGLFEMDERRMFSAFAEGIIPMEMRTAGVGAEPVLATFAGQALAAFIVTCEIINKDYHIMNDPSWSVSTGNFDPPYLLQTINANFTVDEVLKLHPTHITPRYINIDFIKNHDGSTPFEVGKQYVVIGTYQRAFGIGKLTIDMREVEVKSTKVGYVYSNEEINDLLRSMWMPVYLGSNWFPLEIIEYNFEQQISFEDEFFGFVEIKGSPEETKSSERWQPMKDALESAEISTKSFQILTTDNPNSLLRFNQNRNLFDEGRAFTREEIAEGAQVCLVSRQLADLNELTVGDTIPMQLYAPQMQAIMLTYLQSDGGNYVTETFWIPDLFHSDMEVSEPTEFIIVGIYNTHKMDRSEYAILSNTVVIPESSFDGITSEPDEQFDASISVPLISNSMIVPNGKIQETRDAIDSIVPGYGGLFRFYDQGYNSLVLVLGNLRFGMSWILALSAAGWAAVLLIFLLFYVTRKRMEAALLYAIGISRLNRFGWVFTQCAIIVLVALGISIAASLYVYGDILDIAAGSAQAFTDSFRDLTLSDAADAGLRSRIPLDRSPLALLVTVAGASVITLIAAGLISSRSVVFKSLNEKRGDD